MQYTFAAKTGGKNDRTVRRCKSRSRRGGQSYWHRGAWRHSAVLLGWYLQHQHRKSYPRRRTRSLSVWLSSLHHALYYLLSAAGWLLFQFHPRPQGIAFFLIIRPDQGKSTKRPLALLATLRFNQKKQQTSTARCAQDTKHAKKDIMTAGWRRSQLTCTQSGKQPEPVICSQGLTFLWSFVLIKENQQKNP